MSANLPDKVHSSLGASSAARWMACPGSIRLSRGAPRYDTDHSLAGTAAHAVAELALRKNLDPETWLDTSVEGVVIDEDIVEAVRVYVNYCRGINADLSAGGRYWIEHRFTLGELNPPDAMFGTCDFAVYDPETRELEIVDYKNGSGVIVEAKGNKQLRYYALGAALTLGKGIAVDTVKMTIVQPRAAHPDGVIRSETIDYLELLAFAGELLDAARATLDPAAPLHPGQHCRFCPASALCPAQRDQAQALAQVAFQDMPLDVPPAPEALPPALFGEILGKLHILEDWAKAMRAHAMREMEAGRTVPGFKLVKKRAKRAWTSDKEVERFLWDEKGLREEEMYAPRELRSPAQIEKVIGKKNLPAGLVKSESSGYTLVPDSDPRPAVALTPGDAFVALTSGED